MGTMKHLELKYARADIKAFDKATGTAEAVVSVFGNVDLGGDRVLPGAFEKTLQEWAAKGDPIPVIWSHEWDDPESHIGWVLDAAERTDLGGLWVKWQLDVEANTKAAYVARLLQQRRVTQFSFGYYARSYNYINENGQTIRELTDIDLFEVGPTLLGMNPETTLLQAASRTIEDAKAGRVLSAKNEELLVQARDIITTVLAQLQTDESPKADQDAGAKSVETDQEPAVEQPAGEPENDEPTEEAGSRDTPANMENVNREWLHLLTRPRYTEE